MYIVNKILLAIRLKISYFAWCITLSTESSMFFYAQQFRIKMYRVIATHLLIYLWSQNSISYLQQVYQVQLKSRFQSSGLADWPDLSGYPRRLCHKPCYPDVGGDATNVWEERCLNDALALRCPCQAEKLHHLHATQTVNEDLDGNVSNSGFRRLQVFSTVLESNRRLQLMHCFRGQPPKHICRCFRADENGGNVSRPRTGDVANATVECSENGCKNK